MIDYTALEQSSPWSKLLSVCPWIRATIKTMGKRKTREQEAKATLAEVAREMAKPRVAMSARKRSSVVRNRKLVVKNNVQK